MKSIGELIKEARIEKKISRSKLEEETKIKKEFIEAIEEKHWDKLPEYPVVVGFVKRLATHLDISPSSAVAVLRRDYPPKALSINPKPDVKDKFSWSPKLTFITGVIITVLLIATYLIIQYLHFIEPPKLVVESPQDGREVRQLDIVVNGTTDPAANVAVNNQPALVDENGNFSAEIEISEETKEIEVVAKSRSGKETRVVRKIEVQLE